MRIDDTEIGDEHPPYVIAEMSANHNGNLQSALNLVAEAKKAGASAVKLQTYTADTITLPSDGEDFQVKHGLWAGRTLYELYDWAHTPWDWHEQLFNQAKKVGITIFSSPFDSTAVDLLEELGTPAYKIASFEMVDHELIRRVAKTSKPIIISTGLANETEIEEAVTCARSFGAEDLALLHCVSAYPADVTDYNLRTLEHMRERYGVLVGLSDHTVGNATAIAATALGACIVEKHFTLDRSVGGPDDAFSVEPNELRDLCRDVSIAWKSLGSEFHVGGVNELANLQFRRSLYVTKDVQAGELVTPGNVRSVRPGFGLPVKYYDQVMGRRFKRPVKAFERLVLEDLET